jgi:hypothetical protein
MGSTAKIHLDSIQAIFPLFQRAEFNNGDPVAGRFLAKTDGYAPTGQRI